MKIASSSIGMESDRVYTAVRMDAYQTTVSRMGIGEFVDSLSKNIKDKENEESQNNEKKKNKENDNAYMSNYQESLDYMRGKINELSTMRFDMNNARKTDVEDSYAKLRQLCIRYLLFLLMGEKARNIIDNFDLNYGSMQNTFVETKTNTEMHYYSEEESTSYKTSGKVMTEDGREIDFGIEFTMSRSFEEYFECSEESISFGMQLMDPLVINLDGDIAEVSNQKFVFDLNSDGKMDEVAMLSSRSGFLAIDKNEDGIINDGNELFGTKSGDGFRDLAKYDSDKNGWIDENDEIYSKLKIMTVNEDGSTSLFSIKDKDVGAIYLGHVETNFTLSDRKTNEVNAAIRKTGLFLYENGSAGTVQHVDLAVELGA